MTAAKTLTASDRAILTALATLPERFGLYDMLGATLPPGTPSPRRNDRKRQSARRNAQQEAALKSWYTLKQTDLIRIAGYDVECRGNLYMITAAGREALAVTKGPVDA